MTEEKQEKENAGKTALDSRFWKVFLVLLTALLIFIGPTYGVYVLVNVLKRSFAVSIISGSALFVVGLALLRYLISKKVIS
jgi:uncharacterized membrane protein HdeD (DUF308 family)